MPSQNKKPLRQLAAEKLNGPNANPSQLGDPISMKSETNTDTPRNVEYTPEGAEAPASMSSAPSNKTASGENRTKAYGAPRNDPAGNVSSSLAGGKKEKLRTPSGKRIPLEGDPTSLEREQVVSDARGVREEENGPVGRGSVRRGSKL